MATAICHRYQTIKNIFVYLFTNEKVCVTLQSVKASGAKITVSWNKGAASGCQVIYARNKQFKNGESILVGGSNKATTYYAPYSGTYYVHLRPYKNLNGKSITALGAIPRL